MIVTPAVKGMFRGRNWDDDASRGWMLLEESLKQTNKYICKTPSSRFVTYDNITERGFILGIISEDITSASFAP